MTTAEAAAKWAEAKDLLGVAKAGFDAAHAALEAAETAEHEAWEALETLAGRVPVAAEPVKNDAEVTWTGRLAVSSDDIKRAGLSYHPRGGIG